MGRVLLDPKRFDDARFELREKRRQPFDGEVLEPRIVGGRQGCRISSRTGEGLSPCEVALAELFMPITTNPKLSMRVFGLF